MKIYDVRSGGETPLSLSLSAGKILKSFTQLHNSFPARILAPSSRDIFSFGDISPALARRKESFFRQLYNKSGLLSSSSFLLSPFFSYRENDYGRNARARTLCLLYFFPPQFWNGSLLRPASGERSFFPLSLSFSLSLASSTSTSFSRRLTKELGKLRDPAGGSKKKESEKNAERARDGKKGERE